MDEGTLLKSFISTTLDLPPSCIEFSQVLPEYFVVGTYNLEKADAEDTKGEGEDEEVEGSGSKGKEKRKQERNGSLVLYRLEDDEL